MEENPLKFLSRLGETPEPCPPHLRERILKELRAQGKEGPGGKNTGEN